MKTTTFLGAALVTALALTTAGAGDTAWTPLFNGKDLTGWDTWLGKPDKAQKDLGEIDPTEPIGLNRDPLKVYTVVQIDGQPAIRISGQVFGALTSKDDFGNYHLKLEFKWGEQKWPPREKAVRDSGLL